YLVPYEGAAAAFVKQMDAVEKLIVRKNRLDDVKKIRDLAAAKFAEIDATLMHARSGDRAAALAIVNSDRGKQLMDETRELVGRMIAFDDKVLKERLAEATAAAELIQWGIIAIIAAVILLAIYVIATTSRYVRALVHS